MSDENMTNPEVTPVETPVERELTQEEMPNTPTSPVEEGKPVGPATIVEMDAPTEVFPTQGDDTTATQ